MQFRNVIYLIDWARGPYGGILVEFSFYVFMDRAAVTWDQAHLPLPPSKKKNDRSKRKEGLIQLLAKRRFCLTSGFRRDDLCSIMASKTSVYTEDQFSKALAESLAGFSLKSLKPEQKKCIRQVICVKEDVLAIFSKQALGRVFISSFRKFWSISAQGRNRLCTVCHHCG